MTLATIRQLFDYDRWANDRLFGAVEALEDEERRRDLESSHKSLFDTLLHIVGAEEVWLSRWKGAPRKLPGRDEVPDWAALSRRWQELRDELQRFLREMTEEKLDEVLEVTTFSGDRFEHPYREMMQHLANHSSYHRGQLATMLRQLGARPPATDLILYYRRGSGGG